MPDQVRTEPGRTPDAVLFPTGWNPPRTRDRERDATGRNHQLCLHFEAILGAQAGQTAFIRDVGPDRWLATLSPHDTLHHPEGHPRAKFPRYDWEDADGGLRLGYLKPDDEAR